MSDYVSEFQFQLTTPLPCHIGGSVEQVQELTLKAPSNKQRIEAGKLKQGFFRALKGMANPDGNVDTQESKGDGSINGDEVISIILMSDVDFGEYQDNFRTLLLNGACFAKDQKLTAPMYDDLTDADTEKLMGEYVATFLLASHLKKMQAK